MKDSFSHFERKIYLESCRREEKQSKLFNRMIDILSSDQLAHFREIKENKQECDSYTFEERYQSYLEEIENEQNKTKEKYFKSY